MASTSKVINCIKEHLFIWQPEMSLWSITRSIDLGHLVCCTAPISCFKMVFIAFDISSSVDLKFGGEEQNDLISPQGMIVLKFKADVWCVQTEGNKWMIEVDTRNTSFFTSQFTKRSQLSRKDKDEKINVEDNLQCIIQPSLCPTAFSWTIPKYDCMLGERVGPDKRPLRGQPTRQRPH